MELTQQERDAIKKYHAAKRDGTQIMRKILKGAKVKPAELDAMDDAGVKASFAQDKLPEWY